MEDYARSLWAFFLFEVSGFIPFAFFDRINMIDEILGVYALLKRNQY